MITLYTFGPNFGMPDPSPFVFKAMILLKMAGLDYTTDSRFSGFRKAPKSKLPYIDDDGTIVADSYFIRRHIEVTYGFDFDAGLNDREKAVSVAVEKMIEEAFYWVIVYARWIEPQNAPVNSAELFRKMPSFVRAIAPIFARRQIKGYLHGQGLGRHSVEEIRVISATIARSLADILGDRLYLMGETPCGADATALAFIAAATMPPFTSSVAHSIKDFPNLVAYRDRLMARYFGDQS